MDDPNLFFHNFLVNNADALFKDEDEKEKEKHRKQTVIKKTGHEYSASQKSSTSGAIQALDGASSVATTPPQSVTTSSKERAILTTLATVERLVAKPAAPMFPKRLRRSAKRPPTRTACAAGVDEAESRCAWLTTPPTMTSFSKVFPYQTKQRLSGDGMHIPDRL